MKLVFFHLHHRLMIKLKQETSSKCCPMILAACSWVSELVSCNILMAGIIISLIIINIVIEQYVQKSIVRARVLRNPKCSIMAKTIKTENNAIKA